MLPRGVVHSGCPRGEKCSWPILRIQPVCFLAPHIERRSALWALAHWDCACSCVSMEHPPRQQVTGQGGDGNVQQIHTPPAPRSRKPGVLFTFDRHLHTGPRAGMVTNRRAFHQRLLASHLTDSVRSDITDWGVPLLNWPEQSHLPCTVHPHSGRPWIQGWRSVMRRTKKDAVIS